MECVLLDRSLVGDIHSFHLCLLLLWVTVAGEWLPFAHEDASVSNWHTITDSTQSHTAPWLRDKPVLGGVTQNVNLPMLLQTHARSHTIWRWLCRDMLVKAAFKVCLIMKSFDSYDRSSCTPGLRQVFCTRTQGGLWWGHFVCGACSPSLPSHSPGWIDRNEEQVLIFFSSEGTAH